METYYTLITTYLEIYLLTDGFIFDYFLKVKKYLTLIELLFSECAEQNAQ